MAAYLQFIAGDFGKTKYFYKGRDSFSSNNIFSKSLSLSDIATCEEQGAGESIKKAGGTVGGAVIGGVLTGGVGAIVGGMAGGNQVETTVVITTRDGKQGLARANGPMMDAIRGHFFEAQLARDRGDAQPQTKPKQAPLWKQLIFGLIGAAIIFAVFGKDKAEQPSPSATSASAPAASSADAPKKAPKDPCEGITPKRWDEASMLWKASHQECKPKGR